MQALILGADRRLRLERAPLTPRSGECRIRVTYAGICGTDVQMLDGYADFAGTPGHEFVGVVESAPPQDARWIGKRIVGEINVGCGTCEWCARGVKEHCSERTVIGIRGRAGAFAGELSLPAANLHEVPPSIDDQSAVFVEPIAAACRILEQTNITPETRVAVVGDGRLGNLAAQVLRTRTAKVVLFGRHAHKLAVARAVGIDARDAAQSEGRYEVVVDATGRPEGFARALTLIEPRGTIVLKSTCHGDATMPLWTIPVQEITVIGSRCGPFAPAIELLKSDIVQTAPLVAHCFPLEECERAFEAARRELKVLFSCTPAGAPSRRWRD
jgi:threonine dehydrogenase-like Zn-dependent dehydrogenase